MKKVVGLVLMAMLSLSVFNFSTFADTSASPEIYGVEPGTVVNSGEDWKIVYCGREEIFSEVVPFSDVLRTRTFKFEFQKERFDGIPILKLYATIMTVDDGGNVWDLYSDQYEYERLLGLLDVYYWERTYRNGTYLRAATKYRYVTNEFGPFAYNFKIDSFSGSVVFTGSD